MCIHSQFSLLLLTSDCCLSLREVLAEIHLACAKTRVLLNITGPYQQKNF